MGAAANSGGFVHIVKELAVLATSLPPGIWLRVDEDRIDCIKVCLPSLPFFLFLFVSFHSRTDGLIWGTQCMISGPVDTPYAGGLFEFDVMLPLTYPNTPPLVWLKTTGGESFFRLLLTRLSSAADLGFVR